MSSDKNPDDLVNSGHPPSHGSCETLPISPSERLVASSSQNIPQPHGHGGHVQQIYHEGVQGQFTTPSAPGPVYPHQGGAPPVHLAGQTTTTMLPPEALPNRSYYTSPGPGADPNQLYPMVTNPEDGLIISPGEVAVEKVYSEGGSVEQSSQEEQANLQSLGPSVIHQVPVVNQAPKQNPPPSGTKRPAPAPERATRLPVSRIKTMMKFDPDVNIIAQEAAYLVAKSSEQFIEIFAKKAYAKTLNEKRKTMKFKDCEAAIAEDPRFCFLDGIELNQ